MNTIQQSITGVQNNKKLKIFLIVIFSVIIIVGIILVALWKSGVIFKEHYQSTDDARGMDSAYVQNAALYRPKIQTTTLGVSAVQDPEYNAYSQESQAQVLESNAITEGINAVQTALINDADVNENTFETQFQNQLITKAKNANIYDQGLTRRGGLNELQSRQLQASNSYTFDKGGEVPAIYQDVLASKNNTIATIQTNTYIQNIDANGNSYIPQ